MEDGLTDDQRGVADLISMISEELYCAGWRYGIEFELWGYLVDPEAPIPRWNQRPNGGLLKLLKYGSEMIGGWIRHDEELDRVFVPLDDWLELYAKYQDRKQAEAASAEPVPLETIEQMFADWEKDPLDYEEWRHIASPAAGLSPPTSADPVDRLFEEFKDDPRLWAEVWSGEIAEDLSRFINELGVSKLELARRAGVRPSLITRVLKGRADVTLLTISRLALALDQTPRSVRWIPFPKRLAATEGD